MYPMTKFPFPRDNQNIHSINTALQELIKWTELTLNTEIYLDGRFYAYILLAITRSYAYNFLLTYHPFH